MSDEIVVSGLRGISRVLFPQDKTQVMSGHYYINGYFIPRTGGIRTRKPEFIPFAGAQVVPILSRPLG